MGMVTLCWSRLYRLSVYGCCVVCCCRRPAVWCGVKIMRAFTSLHFYNRIPAHVTERPCVRGCIHDSCPWGGFEWTPRGAPAHLVLLGGVTRLWVAPTPRHPSVALSVQSRDTVSTISTARRSCPSGALWACAGRPSAARCASSWFGLTTSPAPRLGRACDVLRA